METFDGYYIILLLAVPLSLALFLVFFRQRPLMLLMVNIFFPFFLSLFTYNLIIVGIAEAGLMLATGLLLLMKSAAGWKGGSLNSPLTLFFAVWCYAVLFSACLGLYLKNGTAYIAGDTFKFLWPVMIFWLSLYLIKSGEDVKKLYWSVLVMIGAICLVDFFFFLKAVGEIGGGIFAMGYRGPSHALSALGIIMATAIMPELKGNKKIVPLYLLYLVMFAVALFRTGYFAVTFSFFVMMALMVLRGKGWERFLPVAALLPMIFAALFLTMNLFSSYLDTDMMDNVKNRVASISDFMESDGAQVRLSEIEAVREQILPDRPALGLGMGGTIVALNDREGRFLVGQVVSSRMGRKHFIHNNLFEILARTGYAGALIYIALLLFFFLKLLKSYFGQEDPYKRQMLLGIAGLFCASVVMSGNGPAMNSTLLMLSMAMTFCMDRKAVEET